jgi:G:T-mismatch repair DNA endonuclease (very short patch repair protein)
MKVVGFFIFSILPFDISGVFINKKVGKKIIIDEDLVIENYLKGKSSILIAKEFNVSKPTILKILHEKKVVRKKDRCKSIKINKINGKFITTRICPNCHKEIYVTTTNFTTTCRNYFKAIEKNSICKDCLNNSLGGEKNPFHGKKHSEKTKKQISKSRTGMATGENNAMSNKIWKEKARKNLKKRWDNGELEYVRKIMSDKLKETRKLGKIKSVIRSKTEKQIIKEIKSLGYKVIHSYKVQTKICDIYIPKLNLIIEFNGDYWHCNPNKYDKNYFHQVKGVTAEKLWEYDKNKVDIILNNGYNLEVVWESDYKLDKTIINKLIKKYDAK